MMIHDIAGRHGSAGGIDTQYNRLHRPVFGRFIKLLDEQTHRIFALAYQPPFLPVDEQAVNIDDRDLVVDKQATIPLYLGLFQFAVGAYQTDLNGRLSTARQCDH